MKTMKELNEWTVSQLALNQDLLNYLSAPVIKQYTDTVEEDRECRERLDYLGKLSVVFETESLKLNVNACF